MTKPVRTRFAPSPTGFLHIGGVRTALLNYLFAKSQGGQFILRIEDTDRTRLVEGAEDALFASLIMLGLGPDEGPQYGRYAPYRQSERLALYRGSLCDLVEAGIAYPCTCDREKIAQHGGGSAMWCNCYQQNNIESNLETLHKGLSVPWRLHMPDRWDITAVDEIRGTTVFKPGCTGDPIIMKSDGFPTYHFAVVVDDYFMEISHVLRGDEWMATWPIHVYLYEALGWEQPKWIHLPPVLGSSGKKLSKRDGSTNVEDFLDQGFLPEAIINYLAFVGCSFDTDKEVLSLDELVELFDPSRISTGGGVFDIEKLRHINQQHIKAMGDRELIDAIVIELAMDLDVDDNPIVEGDHVRKLLPLLRERMNTIADAKKWLEPVFQRPTSYEKPTALNPKAKRQEPFENGFLLQVCTTILDALPDRAVENPEAIQDVFRSITFVQAGEVKFGDLCAALRMALTGKVVSLPLFEMMSALGREETMKRLELAIQRAKEE